MKKTKYKTYRMVKFRKVLELYQSHENIRFKYQTIEFGKDDIPSKTLKDKQQFKDENKIAEKKLGISSASWSLFGVLAV